MQGVADPLDLSMGWSITQPGVVARVDVEGELGAAASYTVSTTQRPSTPSSSCTDAPPPAAGRAAPKSGARWGVRLSALSSKKTGSLAGCDGGFDVIEESLKDPVMKRLDPLTPDRLVLPDRAALDRVAKHRRAFCKL